MSRGFEKRMGALAKLADNPVAGGLKGIEKESLRVGDDGCLSPKPHPQALGSALTHRYITTDFSEALLEFVTPAYATTREALQSLCDIHQFTIGRLEDEILWAASMPCRVPPDAEIPLARYGTSNVGRMKTVYRRGLGYRYGRLMQTIAGVHFNYSLPETFWPLYRDVAGDHRGADDFRSASYLGLVRNFRRYGWLVLYLFGASPALCRSFAGARPLDMPMMGESTYYGPFATSLRMSDLGYSNRTQARLDISLNGLDEYIRDLKKATRTPEPAYEKIGVKVDGEYRQLNANTLQIENEYYSPIRPKRVARSGERPTGALRRGGVEYVEVRSLDINPFDPAGVNQNTMRFIEAFLIYCAIEDSPPFDEAGFAEARRNQAETARRGRDPDFALERDGERVALAVWAAELVDKVIAVAELVDRGDDSRSYASAAKLMRERIDEPESTPSAMLLGELRISKRGFLDFALELSKSHGRYFRAITPLPGETRRLLEEEAVWSLERQREIERLDTLDFDEFLARYFAD